MPHSSKIINLAIVIPTLNEEHYIGQLLQSLSCQSWKPKEIVVVDAQSNDHTVKIVKSFRKLLPQLQVFQVRRSTIAYQRNYGAKKTTASHILFLDADMVLPTSDTLKEYFEEIQEKKPDIAAAANLPLSDDIIDHLFFKGTDLFIRLIKPLFPSATGMNLYISRKSFQRSRGFDEKIRIWEDVEMVQRVVKSGGKFELLDRPKLFTSVRRHRREGRLRLLWKSVLSTWYIMRYGYEGNKVEYEFGVFHPQRQSEGH